MAMTSDVSVNMKEALLTRTIEAISLDGLDGFTLRSVATNAGCSTAVVFQNFAGKAKLIEAAMDSAFEKDREFHDALTADIGTVALGLDGLAALISGYIELRATRTVPPFWSEILLKHAGLDSPGVSLHRWIEMRVEFWAGRLIAFGLDGTLAPILHTYILMEEVYSYALHDRIEYILMLRETTRALAERYFGAPPRPCESAVSQWASDNESRFRIRAENADGSALRERLMAFAIDDIIAHGIPGLNLKKIAKQANASLSMIAYHFGDTESFVNEAVWRALVQGIPIEVDPNRADGMPLAAIDDWTQLLARLIRPRQEQARPGFYVGVARLIGQAALFARRRKDLLPVILHLRKIEGAGTFRASQTIWPTGLTIERSAATVFGIWIKGQAILNDTCAAISPAGCDDILKSVSFLYTQET
ncbi:hypothetical protein [Novosphingobium sp. BL-52-GroH]|uniref:hypothetical protein n=1 Tax=Novosphingobium sp. BL-52-GroH TaxID=3349877 RepID=UPI00384D5929